MPNRDITSKEFVSEINNALKDYEETNAAELSLLKTIMGIKHEQLIRQKEFLTRKHGKDSEQVTTVTTRLANDELVTKALDREIEIANFKPVTYNGSGWLVHGLVYDKDGKRAEGLKIALFNIETREAIRNIPTVLSGADGYFSITVGTGQVEALKNVKLALAIVPKEGDALMVEKDLQVAPGKIDYRDIHLPAR